MKVLVIPDIHLKPFIFEQASRLMADQIAERAVCLMDIPDDWNQKLNIDLYEDTFDAAIRFARDYPDTLWCYGNHDLSYVWSAMESGYSPMASYMVNKKLRQLQSTIPEANPIRYVQRIDDVLFSHGGLDKGFVLTYVSEAVYNDVDQVLDSIESLGYREMWTDDSPIWLRPQYEHTLLYQEEDFLQVVGHTPVETITREGNLITCDTFSTYRDGTPIGNQEFLVLDTQTWEFKGVKA